MDNKALKKIIDHWGEKKQQIKAIEELSELQKAICKHLIENNGSIDNITEEMADVSIMLNQLLVIFNNEKAVNEIIEQKLARTLKVIESEKKA